MHLRGRPLEEFRRLERHRLDGPALHRERSRPADGDSRGRGVRRSGAALSLAVAAAFGVEVPTQPAVAGGGGVGGVPDVHRLEVRAIGVGIAHALDDAQHAVVVEVLHRVHLRVQADAVDAGQSQRLVFLDADARPRLVVERIAEGNDGVEAVVAAAELHDHEHVVLRHARHARKSRRLCVHREGRAIEEGGDARGGGGQQQAAGQELAAREGVGSIGVGHGGAPVQGLAACVGVEFDQQSWYSGMAVTSSSMP